MDRRFLFLPTLIISLVFILGVAGISLASALFYEGKVFRIVVGYSAGGGFDTYARVIARHMGKYIPGNPTVIVENMPGAGSLIAAKHVFSVAKPDGLTVGHVSGAVFFNHLMERPGYEFDVSKFEFVGAALKEETVCAFTKASGITNLERWMTSKRLLKMGGQAAGDYSTDNVPKILKRALGLPIQVVSGYKGTADIRLAVESGELDGGSWGWDSMRVTWQRALQTGDVIAVLQAVPKSLPGLANVPLAISLAKTEEARQLIEVGIHGGSTVGRTFVLPPGTSKERVQILRKAFFETLRDKELLAELERANLGLNPVTGEELEEELAKMSKIAPELLTKLKDILFK